MSMSIKDSAISGIAWTSIERFAQQTIQFVIGIAIARILSPDDYGVVGMTSIFFAFANTLIDSGFGSALVQKKDRNEEDYTTCFYFNAVVGLVVYALLWFAATYIAEFYHTTILKSVIRILGLSLVINSLSISQTARLTAEMRFREMSLTTIASQLMTGCVGLWMAYNGYGVWSLVFQQLSCCLFRLFIITCVVRWIPKFSFSVKSFRHMFSYGSKILCSGLINTLYDNLYTLVIGRIFSAREVGFYNRGEQFARLPSSTLLGIFMKVAFPLMSQVQDDTQKLQTAYKKFLRTPIFFLYPILFSLIVLAEPTISTFIGEKWLQTVPLLQVLCIGAFFDPLTHINLNILYVKGRTDLVLKLELIKKPIAFLILFGMIPLGLYWLCLGRSIYGLIAYSINCHYTKKFINFGFWSQMTYNIPVLLKSAFAATTSLFSTLPFSEPLEQLIVGVITAIVSYLAINIVTHDETLFDMVEIILKKRKRN